jgi:uncharacterized protein YjbJ (UPF0337 family)
VILAGAGLALSGTAAAFSVATLGRPADVGHTSAWRSHDMLHKDEVAGKVDQAKGKIKQKVGELTDDPQLIDEGVDDEATGEVKEGVGTVKRKVADVADSVADKVRRS